MVSIRVEIRGGVLVPLDDISALVPGTKAEIEVVQRHNSPEHIAAVKAQLAQSRGAWADLDGIEEFLAAQREQELERWRKRFDIL